MKIEVHHLSKYPTAAWNEFSKIQKVIKVQMTPPKSSVPDDKVRHAFRIHYVTENHCYMLIGLVGYQTVEITCVTCHLKVICADPTV
jgi:cytochrome c